MFRTSKQSIYLDHAAATPVDPCVMRAMQPYWSKDFYNPGGLARGHIAARQAVNNARADVAGTLGARPSEIIFTNGGTESNNIAIQGVITQYTHDHPETIPHVITSSIEHVAVLETCQELQQAGKITLTEIPVDEAGQIDQNALKAALTEQTILVSVMYANNEIGTIQPIRDIAKTIRWYKKQTKQTTYPLFHTDAIQAANYLDMHVERLGIDLLSISAAKIYGPKGIGVLYIKPNTPIVSILTGGGQEFGMRPGTENVPLIIGMARALTLASEMRESETERLQQLQDYFFSSLARLSDPNVIINGGRHDRLPNNINVSFPGISGEQLVIELDARGIACSSQSACSADSDDISHVIQALRPNADIESGSLRMTLGRSTTKRDIDRAIKALGEAIEKLVSTRKRFAE